MSRDPNADPVRFGTGRGVEEHVNDGVEVIVAGLSGSGIIREDRGERALSDGVGGRSLKYLQREIRAATRGPSMRHLRQYILLVYITEEATRWRRRSCS